MDAFCIDELHIILNKQGANEYSKVSYPLRYGQFSEIATSDYIFQFNLNGEIRFIIGRGKNWPDPFEYLKHTICNNWVYYSTGGYSGVYDSFGEHYLPCPSYPTNTIYVGDPFQTDSVQSAINVWHNTHERLKTLHLNDLPCALKNFLGQVKRVTSKDLAERSSTLKAIIGDSITVLPPDTRHVDYDVIPIIVADGCLYKCPFCNVKSPKDFSCRTKEDISIQIDRLKKFFGPDIYNYNALFLAQHDALRAGGELLDFTARYAYERFDFMRSNLKGASLFLFGSAESLINSDDMVFERLNELPFLTYINIGLESADQETLAFLQKPLTPQYVDEAFEKMLDINNRFSKIEITANFVFGNDLPKGHLPAFFHLLDRKLDRFYSKGAIYFSPLMNGRRQEKRGIKRAFYKIKTRSRLPTFLYLIQKL